VIDYEAADRAEALRAEPGPVAVAGDDQQACAHRGGDYFPLDPSGPLQLGAGHAQLRGSGLEDLHSRGGRHFLDPQAGVTLGVAAAEEPGVGAVRCTGRICPGDVQQGDLTRPGCVVADGVDAGGPGVLGDPGDHFHGYQPSRAGSETQGQSQQGCRGVGQNAQLCCASTLLHEQNGRFRTLREAASGAAISGTGDVFVMRMNDPRIGDFGMYNHVVEYEPDRRIGWEPENGRWHRLTRLTAGQQ
jgi:hypothetical protein